MLKAFLIKFRNADYMHAYLFYFKKIFKKRIKAVVFSTLSECQEVGKGFQKKVYRNCSLRASWKYSIELLVMLLYTVVRIHIIPFTMFNSYLCKHYLIFLTSKCFLLPLIWNMWSLYCEITNYINISSRSNYKVKIKRS